MDLHWLSAAQTCTYGRQFYPMSTTAAHLPAALHAKWDGVSDYRTQSNGAGGGSLNSSPYVITVSGANVYVSSAFTDVNNGGTILGAADYIAKWDRINSALGSSGATDDSCPLAVTSPPSPSAARMCTRAGTSPTWQRGTVLGAADNIAVGRPYEEIGRLWEATARRRRIVDGDVRAIVVSGTDVYIGSSFYV